MTPKEKAENIFISFLEADILMDEISAKQCALIAVDEIITNRERIKGIDKLYWQEVRNEIEKI